MARRGFESAQRIQWRQQIGHGATIMPVSSRRLATDFLWQAYLRFPVLCERRRILSERSPRLHPSTGRWSTATFEKAAHRILAEDFPCSNPDGSLFDKPLSPGEQ